MSLTLCPASLAAQTAAASIATHALPVPGSFIDSAGNVYTAGSVVGTGLPVTPGAAQTQPGGGTCGFAPGSIIAAPLSCSDAYLAKTDASGKLIFGTLLGGPTGDSATALTVDSAGNIFAIGTTGGSFPTTANAAIPSSTSSTAFAAKLSADGSRFLYSTYLPATVWTASAIAVDSQGNAYIAGQTTAGHAFVAKLNAAGSAFLYNVTLPGTQVESATALVTDAGANAIVAGWTNSSEIWESPGIVQTVPGGAQNVFVGKLDASGNPVLSTVLGGSGADTPRAVQIDAAENIYVAGQTTSLDFPTTAGSFQPSPVVPLWNNTGPGGFIFKLAAEGSTVVYSSYVPSLDSAQPGVRSLAIAASGEAYLAGSAGAGFPVTASAPQICLAGSTDAFVAHLDPSSGALLDATYAGGPLDDTVGALALATDGSLLLAWYANVTGNHSLSRIQFGGAGWIAPACLSPDAVNAATLRSLGGATPFGVAPGEFITLTGFGIGPSNGVAYQLDAQGQIPRQLAGVQVLFDGQAAPVLYAQSRQVNAMAPVELSGQASTNISVIYNGVTLGPVTVPVVFGAPGIFRLQPGVSSQASALNQDGTLNGPSNPASRGSIVTVWGTGLGPTDPACPTGGLNASAAVNLTPDISVWIADFDGNFDGIPEGVANRAWYAGSAPALECGVVQINMVVPSYAQPGPYVFYPMEMLASPGGSLSVQSPVGATIAVK